MPPNRECPWCRALVPDWHFEWYSQDEQREIVAGRAAMECPFCKAGVGYDTFDLFPASAAVRIVKRDAAKAALWANYNDGKTLKEYLGTGLGRIYADLWSDTEVEKADNDAINSP